MEIEQAVGAVRFLITNRVHEIQAWNCLDEVLTIVQNHEQRVKDAEQAIRREVLKLDQIKVQAQSEVSAFHEAKARLEDDRCQFHAGLKVEKEQARIQWEHEFAQLKNDVELLRAVEAELLAKNEAVRNDISTKEAEYTRVSQNLAMAKQAMAAFKDSIEV